MILNAVIPPILAESTALSVLTNALDMRDSEMCRGMAYEESPNVDWFLQWSWSDESEGELSGATSDDVQIEAKFPLSRPDVANRLRALGFEPMSGGERWNIWAYEGKPAAVHQVLITALEALDGQAWRAIDVYPVSV